MNYRVKPRGPKVPDPLKDLIKHIDKKEAEVAKE